MLANRAAFLITFFLSHPMLLFVEALYSLLTLYSPRMGMAGPIIYSFIILATK